MRTISSTSDRQKREGMIGMVKRRAIVGFVQDRQRSLRGLGPGSASFSIRMGHKLHTPLKLAVPKDGGQTYSIDIINDPRASSGELFDWPPDISLEGDGSGNPYRWRMHQRLYGRVFECP